MNRRTALKICGGFLFLPSLRLRPEYDLHRIVSGFCQTPNDPIRRYDLATPFVSDGMAYGTDARAAARIVTTDSDTDADERCIPKSMTWIWNHFWNENGTWFRPPLERLIEGDGPCPNCLGLWTECKRCDGWGCDACNGHGGYTNPHCSLCHGEGWGWFPNMQPVGHKLVAVELWRKIQTIPGARLNLGSPNRDNPILVKSDLGVEALVMPCCKR